jgi:pyrroloquinoline quinone biosynthesis protein D
MFAYSDRPVLAPGVRRHTDPVTGESVLLYPEGILVLNESAGAIVALCDGSKSVEEMASHLAIEFDAPVDELKSDLLACLLDLRERNLMSIIA